MADQNQSLNKISLDEKSLTDILIIEDDPLLLKFYVYYTKNLHLFKTIIVARDGAEGFRKLVNQPFGLVVVDLNMPKLDGEKLITYILSENFQKSQGNRKTPNILVISAYLNNDVVNSLTQLGVKHFMEKPFSKKMFEDKIIKITTEEKNNITNLIAKAS